ncbi:hypothetical protein CRUP_016039 [Coryphaenoides rupestris]|nr:hypothetical protein CRUP_016039 [Coryphaenoides rupestris]
MERAISERMIKHERDKHNEPNPQRYYIIITFITIIITLSSSSPFKSFDFMSLQSVSKTRLTGSSSGSPESSGSERAAAQHGSFMAMRHMLAKRVTFNKIQNTKNTMRRDGISSLAYRLVQVKRFPLYTNISVEIGKPPPRPFKG